MITDLKSETESSISDVNYTMGAPNWNTSIKLQRKNIPYLIVADLVCTSLYEVCGPHISYWFSKDLGLLF